MLYDILKAFTGYAKGETGVSIPDELAAVAVRKGWARPVAKKLPADNKANKLPVENKAE